MIQNHRPYQLILSKTGSPLCAGLIARAAACRGAWQLALCGLHRADARALPGVQQARAALEAVYPKPQSAEAFPPLPPQDKDMDLSIIIPAYNVERYIDRCIQSILSQECSCRFQVIVVDGDSQDQTLAHLYAYRNDPRMIIVETKGRGSAARGRNEGLLHATGRWLMFVDSDDLLAPGAIQTLMDAASRMDADVVQGGWQYIDEADQPGAVQTYVDAVYTGEKRLDRLDLPGMPWGKIYRRSLFEQIRFPANYTCFEDAIIHFLIFRKAEVVGSIPALVYLWRKNSSGLTASSQHRPAAVQSYWLMEELLVQEQRLGLPHDDLFCASFTMQLSNYCYATIARMDPAVQQSIFVLCCELYARVVRPGSAKGLPYPIRCGAKALEERRFDLWCRQGQLFRLF